MKASGVGAILFQRWRFLMGAKDSRVDRLQRRIHEMRISGSRCHLREIIGNGNVLTMSANELLTFVLVLGTAKLAFLAFLFLGPPPAVTPLSPREPARSVTVQGADTSRVQAIRATPASRSIRLAQNHPEARGAAGPPPQILRLFHGLLTAPTCSVFAPPCPGLGPRAPPV